MRCISRPPATRTARIETSTRAPAPVPLKPVNRSSPARNRIDPQGVVAIARQRDALRTPGWPTKKALGIRTRQANPISRAADPDTTNPLRDHRPGGRSTAGRGRGGAWATFSRSAGASASPSVVAVPVVGLVSVVPKLAGAGGRAVRPSEVRRERRVLPRPFGPGDPALVAAGGAGFRGGGARGGGRGGEGRAGRGDQADQRCEDDEGESHGIVASFLKGRGTGAAPPAISRVAGALSPIIQHRARAAGPGSRPIRRGGEAGNHQPRCPRP